MAVIEQFTFKGKDLGLLVFLYPCVPILTVIYEFIPNKRVIVISEDDPFMRYPDKEVIQITRRASIILDTLEGFLRTLAKMGVRATDHQIRLLLYDVSEEEFWYNTKIAYVLKYFRNIPAKRSDAHSTLLDLYQCLFHDFIAAFRHYENLRQSRSARGILSALMDLTTKARDLHEHVFHPSYRKVLRANREYLPIFNIALHKYLRHPGALGKDDKDIGRSDSALLTLLYDCANFKNLKGDHFDQVPIDSILQKFGYTESERQRFLADYPGGLM